MKDDWTISKSYGGATAERAPRRNSDEVSVESDADGLYVRIDNHDQYRGYYATALIPWSVVDALRASLTQPSEAGK